MDPDLPFLDMVFFLNIFLKLGIFKITCKNSYLNRFKLLTSVCIMFSWFLKEKNPILTCLDSAKKFPYLYRSGVTTLLYLCVYVYVVD